MSLLSDTDLASMRSTLDESLPDTAIIQSGTVVPDGGGGGTTTWLNAGTVACRLSPIRGNEQIEGARISPEAEWVVTFPAETSIDRDDRVSIAAQDFTGAITALRAPRSWELCVRAECKEIT